MTKNFSRYRNPVIPQAAIPRSLNSGWQSAAAVGLLVASGGAVASGYSTSISPAGTTAVAPGTGTFTVQAIYNYDGNCGIRARVRYVSGSCTPIGDTGWQGPTTACSGGGTASRTYTMSASPTLPCIVSGDGTDNSSYYYTTSYTVQATQTITFNAQSSKTYSSGGTFAISPAASASSGLAVTYGSSTTGVCTVSGTTVTIVSAGTCTITADQGGNAVFAAASQATQNVTINPASQTITFNPQTTTSYLFSSGGTFAISPTASASSGLAVTYGSSTTGVCTVAGTTVTMVGIGTCTITANQSGNTNYSAAAQQTQSVSLTKGTQVITFGAQAAQTYSSGGTFAISPLATTPSSSPVVYSSLTAGVCTIAGSTVTIVTAGTCTIAANAAADSNYNAAAQVTQNITINKATQTITFGANPGPKTYGNAPFAVSATTPSTSPVTFSSTTTGVCTIAGSTVTIVTAGTCTIAANAVADTNYNAAAQATQSITINKATQSITFGAQAAQTYSSGSTFALSPVATASTGLAVSYSSTTPGVCTIAGTTVTMVTGGTCTIAANQAGNANYSAALQVTQNIAIGIASQTITVTTAAPASVAGGSTFPVAATASSGLPVAVTTGGSCSGSGTSTGGSSVTITMTAPSGTCTVYYNQVGNVSYAAANQVTNTTTATGLTQTISVTTAAPATAAYASTFPVAATATSGLAVAITTGGGCTGSGSGSATITMTSASISCTVYYNQAGNAVYYAAAQVTSTTTATKADQTITVTSAPPSYAANGASFSVAATASSGLAVAITTSGSCTGSGSASATITMNAASGNCLVSFDQSGNSSYNAAPQVVMGTAAGSGSSTCQSGEGTYSSLQFSDTGGYLGYACNSYSNCHGLNWNPGAGFIGHVLQTQNNLGKTLKFQLAPDGSGYYNIINTTDNTCWVLGNAIYECSGTRTGSNCNAGYLTAIQDSATLPSAPCNYNASTAKWIINNSGSYMTIQAKGDGGFYGDNGSGGYCGGTDGFGLSRTTLGIAPLYGAGGSGDWGDSWVRNAGPSCASTGARITCGGFAPLVPDHIRFEFSSSGAITCGATNVTIKACTNTAGSVGSASTCSPYAGYISLTPGATKGTWGNLTSSPATGFTGASSGITLLDTTAESTTFSYSSPSVVLTNAAPECYNTDTGLVVSCTSALAFSACTFDAVETTTPVSAAGTDLFTKLAGVPFSFDVVGTSAYTGNLTVDLVDASTTAWNCPTATSATLTAAAFTAPSASTGSNTSAFSAGRVSYTTSSANAVKKVWVRIRDQYSTCYRSTDAFTIRPTEFTLALSSSGDPLVAGQYLDANATGFTLTAVARNGWSGNDLLGASTGNLTGGYAAVPTVEWTKVKDWQTAPLPASPTGLITGSNGFNLSVASGNPVTASGTFFFDDFGPMDWSRPIPPGQIIPADQTYTVDDQTFAGPIASDTTTSNDQFKGDCLKGVKAYNNVMDDGVTAAPVNAADKGKYGCYVRSQKPAVTPPALIVTTSRFRPDHYTATTSLTPQAGCNTTYIGQNFGSVSVTLNALSAHGSALPRLNTVTPVSAYVPTFAVSGYNWTNSTTYVAAAGISGFSNFPTFAWTSGIYSVPAAVNIAPTAASSSTPSAPYENLVLGVTITNPPSDTSPSAVFTSCNGSSSATYITNVGQTTTCVTPPPVTPISARAAILKIENSYGSELLDLFVPVKALYYDGSSWKPYTLDNCTTLSPDRIAISNNQTGALASSPVAKSGLSMVNSINDTALVGQTPSQSVRLVGGMAMIKIPKPSATGGIDIALNLGVVVKNSSCATLPDLSAAPALDLRYLQGNWCLTSGVSTKTRDPNARITFGTPKNSYIYMREKY